MSLPRVPTLDCLSDLVLSCFSSPISLIVLCCDAGNESGELPVHVGNASIKEVIQAWDTSTTDSLVAQFEAMQLEREAQKAARKRKEINDAQSDMEAAVEAHEKAQKDLKKARQASSGSCCRRSLSLLGCIIKSFFGLTLNPKQEKRWHGCWQ